MLKCGDSMIDLHTVDFVWGSGRSHQFPGAISSLRSHIEPEDELEADRMLFPAAFFHLSSQRVL